MSKEVLRQPNMTKSQPIVAIEPILVSRVTAAAICGICPSQFDAKVAAGVLPQPTRRLGKPLWCVGALRMAVGDIMVETQETAVEPAAAAESNDDWAPKL